ncbi:Putative oxidoreductase YncB [Candidatus Phaeomarinobacter ectocarpi]|uniref:Putative oxidoreductase YncB n=1 Tax=Candidatus Phaeomarinibacter ectocarpi TaxID=1458461 RepID=X5MFW4_9HYPH|nr:NADP-dependent oxidoreductase [Candidatus Phaeomarinobacter ectocarpi]CDO60219.1 Putative oxidoreductase YncB [Candidatus Phaeomarinobacter ectocarpi]
MRNSNRQWVLRQRPEGDISDGDLELVDAPKPEAGDGEILIRTIYLSLDPTNRIWMSDMDQYMPPVEIGDVMRGGTLGVVEQSNLDGFDVGDIVVPGLGGWQDYTVSDGTGVSKIPAGLGIPLDAFMSVLGATGMTAYFGLLEIGQPKAGETVVVSAAAGAVGSTVGQIAKIKGCRVVGIAGSDEKCKWVVDDLGFDACINYKKENVLEALRRECPNGIDVNFENVGGEILDAVLTLINDNARIPLCGLISTYNAEGDVPGPYMFRNILMKRARVEGFIIIDFLERFAEGQAEMGQWLAEGKLKYRTDIVDGLETAPKALDRLFTGENIGKLLVRVSDEPAA